MKAECIKTDYVYECIKKVECNRCKFMPADEEEWLAGCDGCGMGDLVRDINCEPKFYMEIKDGRTNITWI